jgi:NACalpha-BTF3-like transcription factor
MVDPARMEDEMRESGLKEQDVELVSKQIRAEALKALMERMGSWKM